MIFVITLVALSLCFIYIFNVFSKAKRRLPPGLKETPVERGLPLVGILLQIEYPLHEYLVTLGKKHGNLFRIKLGMRDILVLNDFNIIRKTLKEDGDNFSGRWNNRLFSLITRDSGILFKDGDVWSEQRSFVLKVLRDFGFGKSKSFEMVENESIFLLDELDNADGSSIDISALIPTHTANIISKFIMDKRFSQGDKSLKLIEKLVAGTVKVRDPFLFLYLILPAIDQSEYVAQILLKFYSNMKLFDEIYLFFQNEIQDHLKVLDMNSEGESLIDRFLIKQKEMEEKTGSVGTFTDWQLIRNAFELFIAGYETTSTTLGWSFMFMARFPEIQDRVHNEIVNHIGMERSPTMNDKKSLSYTQAVMDEVFRLSSVTPLGVMHCNLNDTHVDGYFIPKNTLIFPNLFACHTDPEIWERPKEFYPEHFLSRLDNGGIKYNPRDELIPFSTGKRQCLGESLAKMEYFIFFVSVMRKFRVRFTNEISEAKYQDVLRANDGFLRFSSINDFIFDKRF